MLVRIWRKGNPLALLVGMQTGAATVENSIEVLKKVKIELLCDPAIALLGIEPKNTKTLIQRDTCIRMFIAALFKIAKVWKQPKCPSIDEWLRKMWCVYIHIYFNMYIYIYALYNAILFSHKKNETLSFATI